MSLQTFREGSFSLQGFQNFFVESEGEGVPLVFLHPLGGSSRLWEPTWNALKGTYRILAPDFLGCGRSDKPDIPYHLLDFSDRIIAFLDDRKIEEAVLVGNSLGGHVALMVAASVPSRVKGLVLANTSGLKARSLFWFSDAVLLSARFLRRLTVDPPELMMRTVLKTIHGVPGTGAKDLAAFYEEQMSGPESDLWKRAFLRTLQGILSAPVEEDLSEIDLPTLIVWGERDRLLGKGGGERIAGRMKRAKLQNLSDAGHFPPFEQPAKFGKYLENFLSQTLKNG